MQIHFNIIKIPNKKSIFGILHICPWRNWITQQIPILEIGGSNPFGRAKNKYLLSTKRYLFFIQAAGLVYHHRTKCGAYHQGRIAALVSHHAPAYIFLRLDDIPQRVADNMQNFVLMIYKASP